MVAKHYRSQIFEINLMDDARVRRYHLKALKGGLAPAKESVALLVTLKLQQRIRAESLLRSELIDLNGMIDHQIGRDERIG